ncbi:hypothetical protein [Radiobacillus sp. PE A8.2]|uniref:hypothetical protein n=1 Tax=Radiobacillus sp. PE A8.2 TaxID=3380349 RepID=UPI003890ABA1
MRSNIQIRKRSSEREVITDGTKAIIMQANVCEKSLVNSMITEVNEKLGQIDILVNNARTAPFELAISQRLIGLASSSLE